MGTSRRPDWHVRKWREYRGLSLARLAFSAGIPEAELERIESGAQPCDQPTLEALARALRCQPVDLLIHDPADPDGIWPAAGRLDPRREFRVRAIMSLRKAARAARREA